MRLSFVLVLFSISAAFSGSEAIRSLVFPSETSTSYVEMIATKPLKLTAFTLCMRVATELSGEREILLFAYRTNDFDELNVWRELDGRLSFYLSGDGVLFQVPDLGYLQTHLCFTWDSSSGAAAVFMNGRKSQTKIYRKGHTIRPGGRVILGQDPDSFLGEFDAKQSFVGEISDVTMWDSVLSDHAIQSLFNGRRVEKGNVFDWETVELIPFGEVEVMNVDLI
ncbi:pentraxin fusion protein-like [Xiphophorus couchianus]|uniref:pentraxin fusion protein-like n=1 Tax=Xiphophorus couchianus TaxID=32473 RepID=UPI001015D8A2|nr:pentraxin fusion protein-like [Xiphophorus couchianus]